MADLASPRLRVGLGLNTTQAAYVPEHALSTAPASPVDEPVPMHQPELPAKETTTTTSYMLPPSRVPGLPSRPSSRVHQSTWQIVTRGNTCSLMCLRQDG
jgi:hypothetical protein